MQCIRKAGMLHDWIHTRLWIVVRYSHSLLILFILTHLNFFRAKLQHNSVPFIESHALWRVTQKEELMYLLEDPNDKKNSSIPCGWSSSHGIYCRTGVVPNFVYVKWLVSYLKINVQYKSLCSVSQQSLIKTVQKVAAAGIIASGVLSGECDQLTRKPLKMSRNISSLSVSSSINHPFWNVPLRKEAHLSSSKARHLT